MTLEYQPARPEDVDGVVDLLMRCFHVERRRLDRVIERRGLERIRVMRRGGRIAATLQLIFTGQYYGGRAVPACGISWLGTAPESRGSGAGTGVLGEALREIRQRGAALAILFPSTLTFYRNSGFERAGNRVLFEVASDLLPSAPRDGELVHLAPDDIESLKPVYRAWAERQNGLLDRPDVFWHDRLRPTAGHPSAVYLVQHDGRPEGYVALATDTEEHRQTVYDYAALTARAARRVLALLADHRMVFTTTAWYGGDRDPLIWHLPEPRASVAFFSAWMLRVVDVAVALGQRGYASGAAGRLELEVADPALPDNEGRYTLEVQDGRGKVERGGRGRVRIDVRGLAALYTGYASAGLLQRAGLVDGPDQDLRLGDTIFSGPSPWMADYF